ncbi:ATP dependent DNA ligase domain-domain-containing protein [Kockovaella imperatae]|uniref:DNA ligase n=1 Tax=Kockovaella imperatae TaxID=4999 RepID=A0A1Y1U9S1_9TREE|nr:ATP dependent DNA ligase domain-domain-containing protein [Kockovaella imperatae]ORX34780.1 ATP dependent DNA ligase domain-domain-containing protein [Kockovaella imperatae]
MPRPQSEHQAWHRGQKTSEYQGDGGEEDEESYRPPPLAPSATLERPPDCINRNPTPAFSLLCTVMDRLRTEEPSRRRDTLSRFMSIWRAKVGNDLYPLIRLLLPDRDRERPVYNLKEAMLAKCYIEVLGVDKHSETAQRLIKWKQPVDGQAESYSGDFARVCYHEIAARSTVEEGQLTIDAVNALLDKLAAGRLKQQEYVPVLRKINQQCTPVEQEWIIRIILKDLRISIREKGVFSCFHPDAGDLFNVCSDLKRVCWTLYRPDIRLEKHQTNIELFRCFLPQLCYRSPSSSHEAISKLVGAPHKEFIMEEKLDGERIQLHMRNSGAQWFYCSRKAKDYTYLYGAHAGEGSLTQYIAECFDENIRNIILDGEMLVWDPVLEKYLAFGTLKTAASDKRNDEDAPRPCFKVFDILYLNDKCLTSKRLSERKRLLHSGRIFKNIEQFKGRIEFAEERRGKNGKDIREMLERILETKGEGLVVKNIDSVYRTNSRDSDWVKVKPEYSDQMGENLDLLVLGGWWGKGGRTGKISSLLCGLRNQTEDDGVSPFPEFTTFVKIGSGMSYEDYQWILTKHKDHWKPFSRDKIPPWLHLGPSGLDDKPDVYIEPPNSFVVEVKASEIVPAAGNFGVNYTMRFPRCRFIYWDKASRDAGHDDAQDRDMWNCLSVDEFMTLLNAPSKRYADDEAGSTRRKKRKVAPKKKVELIKSARGQRLEESSGQSRIFRGLTFYIIKGTAQHSKQELETLVHDHGGDFSQAQLADNSAYVIAPDDKDVRVRAQKKRGVSIIKPDWILRSIERRRPLALIQDLLVFASDEAKDDRDYFKSLDDLSDDRLVRDRHAKIGSEDRDERVGDDSFVSDNEASGKSRQQSQLEAEWGLEDDDDQSVRSRHMFRAAPSESASPASSRSPSPALEGDADGDETTTLLPLRDSEAVPQHAFGNDSQAMEYDDEKIFTHLVFYVDTPENARANGLTDSSPRPEVSSRLEETKDLILEHGGKVTGNVDDVKLSHIIMDDDDSVRYAEISRRTAKPKRKHIVLPSWVHECLDEETLMNEDGHKPR